MLVVPCPGCQSKLKVKPSLAGRKVKCPKCRTPITIPEADATPGPTTAPKSRKKTSPAAEAPQPTQPAAETTESVPVLPLAPDATVSSAAEPSVGTFDLNTDSTTPSSSSRRRKRRSSVGMWLPILLVLVCGAAALWHFIPGNKPAEVVVKDFGDQSAVEGQPMKLAMPVAGDGQSTELKIVKAPPGATFDQATREFTWTPTEADGPGEFDVTVRVVQGSAIVEARFKVIVSEQDSPPAFTAIEPIPAKPLGEIKVALAAKDPDVPSVAVTYALANSGPKVAASASVNPVTGELKFTPPEVSAGETMTLKVTARELSDAGLSTDMELLIQVAEFEDPVRQLKAELGRLNVEAEVAEAADTDPLPFTGTVSNLRINGHQVTVFRYETASMRQDDVEQVDEGGSKVFDRPWEEAEPLNIFAKDTILVTSVGGESDVLSSLSSALDRPVAVVQPYEAPARVVKQTPVIVAALKPLYEERLKRPGKPRKLFTTDSYKDVRTTFADEFAETYDPDIRSGLGDDYDAVMEWFVERVDLKEELFTAIRPEVDNVSTAMQLFNEIRKTHPEQIDRYGSLAIACAVVWDSSQGVYKYAGQAKRTHSTMPETLMAGLDNFQYFIDAEKVMQGRAQYVPWEFLTHLINHKTPFKERTWAVQAYVPTRQMFGKCYSEVPYDSEMLQTKGRVCRLDGKEYNLPNIRQFGGVCAMQADFAARVGKSIGVPAAYVSGSGRYGGAHAWVMWVELQAVTERSIKFSLESHGRYRGDHYYIGKLRDPHTGRRITDRILELRLHQVGIDAMAKRHSDRVMAVYRQMADEFAFDFETHLEYLSGAVALNPWNEQAWTALSQLSNGREFGRDEHKTMATLLNQLFINFAAFPDFTLTIFDDLVSFEKDLKKRIPYYYRLLEVYSASKRPDLGFTTLLRLSEILEQEDRSAEAIQALAAAIQKYPEEGQYVPKMLDRLEVLAKSVGEADQTMAEFYAAFLPTVPQKRGAMPSMYCIQMYERAVPVFQRAEQFQLAETYTAGAEQMRALKPQ